MHATSATKPLKWRIQNGLIVAEAATLPPPALCVPVMHLSVHLLLCQALLVSVDGEGDRLLAAMGSSSHPASLALLKLGHE